MSVTKKRVSDGKGAGCAPFLTALVLIILIMVSVILALIVANALHITTMIPNFI